MIEIGKAKANKRQNDISRVETILEDIQAEGKSEEILDECLALAIEILTVVPEGIFREADMEEEVIKYKILENKRKIISFLIEGIKEEMEGE